MSPERANTPLNVPEDTASPAQMLIVLHNMNARLGGIAAEQIRQGKRLEQMEQETRGLRRAWEAGGFVVGVAKIIAYIAAAIGAVWAGFWGLASILTRGAP